LPVFVPFSCPVGDSEVFLAAEFLADFDVRVASRMQPPKLGSRDIGFGYKDLDVEIEKQVSFYVRQEGIYSKSQS
jgi:hypothetical protein